MARVLRLLSLLLIGALYALPGSARDSGGGVAGRAAVEAAPATIAAEALPPEARSTLALIERGGPFPHARDGITFGNRERLLPERAHGYYREYTVPTPGVTNRGARRIVAGRGGETYYTDDHYRRFRRITR